MLPITHHQAVLIAGVAICAPITVVRLYTGTHRVHANTWIRITQAARQLGLPAPPQLRTGNRNQVDGISTLGRFEAKR